MEGSNCANTTEPHLLARTLRLQLKEWEQSFAAAHQGRRARRDDIKQLPEIAHKYKQYDRLRRPSSKQLAPHNATPPKKRPVTDSKSVPSSHSPYKRPKHADPLFPSMLCSHDLPSPTFLSPRTHRTSIGPTPQKDGQVLGLFDHLSPASSSQTPSKRKALHSVGGNVAATPCKRPLERDRKDIDKPYRSSPLSSTKSKILNNLLTPSTSRIAECATPPSQSGVSKIRFDETPAFLRRESQRTNVGKETVLGDEEGVSWSPVSIRKLPRAAGRGLSALVRGLREMEDEGLDAELEMLRELENGNTLRNQSGQPEILVNDSQRPDMPLGPNGGLGSDEEDIGNADDGKDKDSKPLKLWKKKGQKRTTRRVLMKPNTAKWKPEPAWNVCQASEDDEDGVAETQSVSADRSTDWKEHGSKSDEYEDTGGVQGATEAGIGRKGAFDGNFEKNDGMAKKVTRISATAHANFRALKIRSKQSKGRKGGRLGRKH